MTRALVWVFAIKTIFYAGLLIGWVIRHWDELKGLPLY